MRSRSGPCSICGASRCCPRPKPLPHASANRSVRYSPSRSAAASRSSLRRQSRNCCAIFPSPTQGCSGVSRPWPSGRRRRRATTSPRLRRRRYAPGVARVPRLPRFRGGRWPPEDGPDIRECRSARSHDLVRRVRSESKAHSCDDRLGHQFHAEVKVTVRPGGALKIGVDDGVRTRDFRSHSPALCH
jgi:hypothetical protein